MSRNFLVFGPSGTTKTSFALSGKGKKWYAELDPGSYDRALKANDVDFHAYYPPLTSLMDMGVLDFSQVGKSGGGPVTVRHHYTGWQETWLDFVRDYYAHLKTGDADYAIIDTSTLMWELIRTALRQRIQDEGGTPEQQAAKLKTLEYDEPNNHLLSIMRGSKAVGKDLVMIAHRGEVYVNDKPTGEWKPDGSKRVIDACDCALMFEVVNNKPVATIYKGGGTPLDIRDLKIRPPYLNLDSVNKILDCARNLRNAGFPLPDSVEEIIAQGEMVG